MTRTDLLLDYFEFDVTIKKNRYGNSAKWSNNLHPDNPDYMQPVYWYAFENNGHVTLTWSLDPLGQRKVYARVPLNGHDFKDIVFEQWAKQ